MHILRKNEPMRLHTTFRVGGPADVYAEPEDEWELREILDTCEAAGTPYLLIGHGSNLLIGDGGFRGTVICLGKAFSDINVDGEVITARAGALLSAVANTALEHGLTGMEFASGIPGSVGGALVMNAGAYGGEIRDILLSADILEMDGSADRTDADGLELGYRSSNITALGRTVLGASFRLKKGDPAEIEAKIRGITIPNYVDNTGTQTGNNQNGSQSSGAVEYDGAEDGLNSGGSTDDQIFTESLDDLPMTEMASFIEPLSDRYDQTRTVVKACNTCYKFLKEYLNWKVT